METEVTSCNKKSYAQQQGVSILQICTDLARIMLNLPLFSKTSLVPPHVHSMEHLLKRPYAVRDCPKNPPTSLPYKYHQPPLKSVKTRRKSLVSNKVYLQIGETINFTTEVAQPRYIECLRHHREIQRKRRVVIKQKRI
jgi:hypothetical protein